MKVGFGPGTVVVVTGAASGIGRALASELHARGARLALLDVDRASLDEWSAERTVASRHACDVSSRRSSRVASFAESSADGLAC